MTCTEENEGPCGWRGIHFIVGMAELLHYDSFVPMEMLLLDIEIEESGSSLQIGRTWQSSCLMCS